MFSPRIIPRKLKELTCSISSLLILTLGTSPVMSFWYGWNTMNFVFDVFNDNPFRINQPYVRDSSLFIEWSSFDMCVGIEYSIVLKSAVSWAYSID